MNKTQSLPATPGRNLTSPERAFLLALSQEHTETTYFELIDLFLYLQRNYTDTVTAVEQAQANGWNITQMIANAKAKSAGMPDEKPHNIEVTTKYREGKLYVEFSESLQFLAFNLEGAKAFAEQMLQIVKHEQGINRRGKK